MKLGADVRRVAYADIESFGGSDDFGAFTFTSGALTGNPACDPNTTAPYLCESAFADFLLGLPAKTYVAQSGPDVVAHTFQTGLYAQDEWHVHPRLTVSFGLRWQALPLFVSPLNNLTAVRHTKWWRNHSRPQRSGTAISGVDQRVCWNI